MLGKDAIEPLTNKLLEKSNKELSQFLILESMSSIAQTEKSCRQNIIDIFIDLLDCKNIDSLVIFIFFKQKHRISRCNNNTYSSNC
jgi:hypothetical protein